jgi:hypothetical protein
MLFLLLLESQGNSPVGLWDKTENFADLFIQAAIEELH